MATYQTIWGNKDLLNQESKSWSRMGALINLWHLLHSWMCSNMWVELYCRREVKIFVPISYQIGNWKWVRNIVANELKSINECCGSLLQHFLIMSVNILWKSLNQIESSIRELDEHHKWKVITWFLGYSPYFSSTFVMSGEIFPEMVGQNRSCWMGSFINLDNLGRSNAAINGSCQLSCG